MLRWTHHGSAACSEIPSRTQTIHGHASDRRHPDRVTHWYASKVTKLSPVPADTATPCAARYRNKTLARRLCQWAREELRNRSMSPCKVRCCWGWKLVKPLWKTVLQFLKKLKIELPYDPVVLLLHLNPDKTRIQKIHACVHNHTIHKSQDMEATWGSTDKMMDKEDVMYIQWNITWP